MAKHIYFLLEIFLLKRSMMMHGNSSFVLTAKIQIRETIELNVSAQVLRLFTILNMQTKIPQFFTGRCVSTLAKYAFAFNFLLP